MGPGSKEGRVNQTFVNGKGLMCWVFRGFQRVPKASARSGSNGRRISLPSTAISRRIIQRVPGIGSATVFTTWRCRSIWASKGDFW